MLVLLAHGRQDQAIHLPSDARSHAARASAYTRPLGAAVSVEPAQKDPAYLARLIDTYTSVTPENAMKWAIVEPRQGHFDFAQADSVVKVATALGKRVRGHPLLWDEQLPGWVTARRWSAAAMTALIRAHVTRIVSRYRGRVALWDVVNEPLENDGSLTRDVFTRALGERFVDVAFRAAHAADPHAKLFLNELAAERPGPKQRALLALAARLKARGVPIDGIGLQNHTDLGGAPGRAALAAAMARIARLGLAVEITEMDVSIPPAVGASPAVLARQAGAYAAAGQACAAAPNCTGLTVWGVDDRWSWLGASKRPLPIDASGRAKPALAALTRALRARR